MLPIACPDLRATAARRVATDAELDEIQAEVRSERAMCLQTADGFVIVGLYPRGGGLELYVWLAVASQRGAFARNEGSLVELARSFGAQAIAFRSRRRGWARRLGDAWKSRGDEYVREVADGQGPGQGRRNPAGARAR